MEWPELGEPHVKLKAMAGDWIGEETMHPSPWNPQRVTAQSHTTAKEAMGGFFILSDYRQERDGQITYEGHGIFGFDPRKQQYTMHWFDSMGGDPGAPALGTWDGDALRFQHQHHRGHSRYTYRFKPDGSYTFKLEQSQDGKEWACFVDGTYRRR